MKEKIMDNLSFTNTVERNKAASKLCSRLFHEWCKPPFQGELQRIIVKSWNSQLEESAIEKAGLWWLWGRNIMIENIFSKQEREIMMDAAVLAASGEKPIHFVSARSPELLHAQISTQGDKSLPRSRKALSKLKEISDASRQFLPTDVTIIFANLAVDNIEKIKEVCSTDTIIEENIGQLKKIIAELQIVSTTILKMSDLITDGRKLSDLLQIDGKPSIEIVLDEHAKKLIEIATHESSESHKRMFGWSEQQSRNHNINIGVTMGLVGKAVKDMDAHTIIIHNESFIARGQLNNIFNRQDNPIPIIALKDLPVCKVRNPAVTV